MSQKGMRGNMNSTQTAYNSCGRVRSNRRVLSCIFSFTMSLSDQSPVTVSHICQSLNSNIACSVTWKGRVRKGGVKGWLSRFASLWMMAMQMRYYKRNTKLVPFNTTEILIILNCTRYRSKNLDHELYKL